MTKSSTIKLASRLVFTPVILGGILFSAGIGVGQELPQSPLAQLVAIPASKFTKVSESENRELKAELTEVKPVENGKNGQN